MPTYEYKCDECGHEFEDVRTVTMRAVAMCPVCGCFGHQEYRTPPSIDVSECRDFPKVTDALDGEQHQHTSKRAYRDHIARYNDGMRAKGRDNWVATCPALD